jgi:hypothetical protein
MVAALAAEPSARAELAARAEAIRVFLISISSRYLVKVSRFEAAQTVSKRREHSRGGEDEDISNS